MSLSNYTRNILDIKDENIIFKENCYEERIINHCTIKCFHAELSYTPTICPNCKCSNEDNPNTIIKYGFKKNCKIKINKIGNYKAMLLLNKQRFYCKKCNSTFTATTSEVGFHKQVSNNTRASIISDLIGKGTEKDIASRNNVSPSTVNRTLDDISRDKLIKNNGILPTVMGIDEFKATKDTISKMAFIIVDQDNKNIFDINNWIYVNF